MDMDKYTRKSLEVIEKAKDKALEYDNQELAQIHLLAGLLEIDESLISKIFEKLDIDVTAAVNRVEDKLASLPKVSGGNLYAGIFQRRSFRLKRKQSRWETALYQLSICSLD